MCSLKQEIITKVEKYGEYNTTSHYYWRIDRRRPDGWIDKIIKRIPQDKRHVWDTMPPSCWAQYEETVAVLAHEEEHSDCN